ncbi:MAG: ATP-binding protein [Syntrophobacteraceae bacterium]
MIKRITVENFMAHKSTALNLAEGVTVITGPNNSGKSALVEAVRSIAQNPPSRTAIRHGEKSAIVRVELESGEIVEWERTEKTALYRIYKAQEDEDASSPETYAKFGRIPPDDIRVLLRLDSVETEAGEVDIHIGNQRYPIFLLDQSGSQAASFFAASTEAEYLLRMQQALKVRTDQNRKKKNELLARRAELKDKLEYLTPLDALGLNLQRAEILYSEIMAEQNALPIFKTLLDELNAVSLRHVSAREHSLVLQCVTPPPALHEVFLLDDLAANLERSTALLFRLVSKHDGFALLQSPPQMHETLSLSEVIQFLEETSIGYEEASARMDVLRDVTGPPAIMHLESLNDLIYRLDAVSESGKYFKARHGILSGTLGPPMLSDTADLFVLASELARAEKALRAGIIRMEALEDIAAPPSLHDLKFLESLVRQMEEWRSEISLSLERSKAVSKLQPPPGIWELNALDMLIDSLVGLDARLDRSESELGVHALLPPFPELSPVNDLCDIMAQVALLQRDAAKRDQLLSEQIEAMAKKRLEIEEAIKEAGTCPLCGRLMDLVHFLEEEEHA